MAGALFAETSTEVGEQPERLQHVGCVGSDDGAAVGQAFFECLDRFVRLVGSTCPCEPPERNDELARVGERTGPPEGVLGGARASSS